MAPHGWVLIAHEDRRVRAQVRSLADRHMLHGTLEADSFDGLQARLRRERRIMLVIVDLDLPGMSSEVGLRSLRSELRDVPIAVMSGDLTDGELDNLCINGNRALVPKRFPEETLSSILERILAGLDAAPQAKASSLARSAPAALRKLTSRQADVLQLLSEGHSNREISQFLGIAEGTVKVHVNAIFRLLGVHNRVGATVAFRENFSRH